MGEVKITGAKEAIQMFKNVESFLKSRKPMENIVKEVKETIEKKTESGKDYMGKKFKPYSAKYAKRKGSTKVDLKLSGKMIGALDTQVINPSHGKVFISSKGYARTRAKTDMLAQIHTTGTGKQPQREFMNLAPSAQQKIIKKYYDDEIMKILGRVK